MGTTSTYFGGGGGATAQSVASYYPLKTTLTPHLPHSTRYETNSNTSPLSQTRAGNPLGNGYSISLSSYNGSWNYYDNVASNFDSVGVGNIESGYTHHIGACYRSDGSIIFCAASGNFLAFRSFPYNSSTPDGNIYVSGVNVASSAIGGLSLGSRTYQHAFYKADDGNYIVKTNTKIFQFNSSFTLLDSWYSVTGNNAVYSSNKIGLSYNYSAQSSTDPSSMKGQIGIQRGNPTGSATYRGFNAILYESQFDGPHMHPIFKKTYWINTLVGGIVGYDDETVIDTGYSAMGRLDVNEVKTLTDEFMTTYGRSYD